MIVARRRAGSGVDRPRRRRQRDDDAARRRRHHRQHAGLDDLAAPSPSRGAARARDEVRARAPATRRRRTLEQLGATGLPRGLRPRDDAPEAGRADPAMQALRDTVVGDVRVPAGSVVCCLMRRDSARASATSATPRFRPERWLGGSGAAHVASSAEARLDAVRRRPAHLPRALPGAARDQDRDRDAARHVRDRRRRARRTAAKPPSTWRSRWRRSGCGCGCASGAESLQHVCCRPPGCPQAASAPSACSQSAIRSSTASRPTEKRTSVPAGACRAAQRPRS